MEYNTKNVNNTKKQSKNEDNINKIKISRKNNDKKEVLKTTNIQKDEFKDKDNKIKMETSENRNSNEKKTSKNINIQKNENIEDTMEISKNENSDKKKVSKSTKTQKNGNIKDMLETSRNENSNEKEALENIHKDKFKIENVKKMETLKNNDEEELLENTNIHNNENKNMKNEMEISESEDNEEDSLENINTYTNEFNDEDTSETEILQDENINGMKNINKDIYEVKNEYENREEYCSDATYLARQMESAEKLTELDKMKLFKLRVKLRHTVLPQHKIETRAGSHTPMAEEIKKFEEIVPIKKGSYSAEEDAIIVTNWKAFCTRHDWDVKELKPFLQLRIGKLTYMRNTTERRKFVQFLADGLPNRTLYSVYHRFRNLYEKKVQRRYTPDEDEMILDHLENNPSLEEKCKYVDLAKVLKRTRHSIWRRYRILKKRKNA